MARRPQNLLSGARKAVVVETGLGRIIISKLRHPIQVGDGKNADDKTYVFEVHRMEADKTPGPHGVDLDRQHFSVDFMVLTDAEKAAVAEALDTVDDDD